MTIEFTPRAAEGVERHIQVSVPAEAVKEAEEKAARRYASTVRLPGFRPGKAPATVVRRKFGEAIRQEALQSLVQDAYQEFVEKESITVASQPHVHDLKFEEGKPLTFELHLELRPTINLARTNGFRIQRTKAKVTDEQITEQLEQIRDEKATWTPVSEKPKPGDMVNVQISTASAGTDMNEGKSYPLVLGAGQAIPGIEELVMSAMPGETVEKPVKWPDDFPDEAQRGQTKTVRITLNEVKRKSAPPLDDALAREVGDFESLDALRNAVRTDLERHAEHEIEANVRQQLIDQIIAANAFDIPKSWIQQFVQNYAEAYQVPEDQRDKFAGHVLDSLPPDVRAVTDADVKKVQEEARALVREQALQRSRSFALSARHLSDLVRFNRVEGLALGTGVLQRLGAGFALAASGRYGFSDEEWKGRGAIEYRTGTGSSLTLAAAREYRDVSEEQETSLVRNSIAAQEFGSDYTDPYDAHVASLVGALGGLSWRPSIEIAYEHHEPLDVHARPANGAFEPTIPAQSLHEARMTLAFDRPTSLSWAGYELGVRIALTGIRRFTSGLTPRADFVRPSITLDVEKPFGSSRFISHTVAAGIFSDDTPPAQHLVYLGGPTTSPGYEFHEFVGRGGISQRIEYRFLSHFVPIPLGRFGTAPGTITLAPFATAVWINESPPFKAARQGWYPSLGLGALTVFDVLRFDVARGLRDGRWTFSVDVGRDFWSVL